ncbi:response regulator transcription factor [Aliikangiella coralliicola]|uniref:response regulator transcription factor n=1 Tax=Aliikangiella coralliicola TaxID=2592383 RepID=UPI001FE956C0|nr:response regulator [Aliikangiella coralliicola]
MTILKIFIIDDDSVFREILTRSLKRMDCQVQHFAHPSDAIEKIAAEREPVVLLDLKLDSDSGLRWIKKIKVSNPQSRIILLTGYASISTAVEAIKLGADDYLAKPITAREILEHLQEKNLGEETPINPKPMSVDRLEWEHIQKVLSDNQGNISASARALGMHRRTLQRKLAKKPAKF